MRGKRIGTIILTLILVSIAAPSFGGLNRWTSGGPEGGWVTAVVSDPAAPFVYAGTHGGGVFRAESGGEPQWKPVNTGLAETVITSLAAHGAANPALYAGTASGRIFRSSDRGNHWTEVDKPSSGAVRSFAFDDTRGRMYAATATGVLTSRDGGRSWQVVPQLAAGALAVAARSNGTLYACMAAGLYVSTDGGENWNSKLTSCGAVAADPVSSAVYVAQSGSVISTTDDGRRWEALPFVPMSVGSLIADGGGLYAATTSGLYVHRKGSSTWSKVGSLSRRLTAVAVAPSSPRRFYAGSQSGMFTLLEESSPWDYAGSQDATFTFLEASQWAPADAGLNAAFVVDVAHMRAELAFAATPGGLFRTFDGAASWGRTDVAEPLTQVAVGGGQSIYVAGENGIRSSTDGGTTWEMITPKIPSALAASASAPATLYAAFSEALAKSTDGGRTWTAVSTGLIVDDGWFYYGFHASVLETDDEDPAAAYVAYSGMLFKTADGGEKWTRVLGQLDYAKSISAVAGRGAIIHAALAQGVATSIDGGKSWSAPRLNDERVWSLAIDPLRPWRSYAGTATGLVYRSDDFGHEWTLFGEGSPLPPVHRLTINDAGDRIYAATAGGVFEYQIGPSVPAERLPTDPLRLPTLIRQLLTGVRSTDNRASVSGSNAAAFILPAVGTVHGSRGMLFRTDVTLSNGRSTEQDVLVAWLPQANASGPAVPMFRVTLPASADHGGTITVNDIADELRLEGLGSIVVIAIDAAGDVDQAAHIDGFARVRTAALCGSGSVSQSVPSAALAGSGTARRARALGLRHDSAYRTNVGIVNLGEETTEFTIVANGQKQSERVTVSVPPFASVQTAVPDRNYGALALTVIGTGGPWVAYGSSVDNASGDGWASVATPLPDL